MSAFSVSKHYQEVGRRVRAALNRAGRQDQFIRLVGATKKQPVEKIIQALECGLGDFGENYVQEWQEKQRKLKDRWGPALPEITWHFIGKLQRNKAKFLVGKIDWIHTLDRLKLAEKVNQLAKESGWLPKVLLEVNLAKEETKSGFWPEALLNQLEELAKLPHLRWKGLMAIPPMSEDPEASRPYFRQLKSLLDECNQSGVFKEPLTELSMGMSQDFEVAIEEGATIIRIGTAIFGPRK